jgi:hypothetical protein
MGERRSAWAIPRFSETRGASLVLRAKRLHYMRHAVIIAAAWMVIFVATASSDPTVEYTLRRVRWTRGAHQLRSVLFPMPPICRFSKAPLPDSTAVFLLHLVGGLGSGPSRRARSSAPTLASFPQVGATTNDHCSRRRGQSAARSACQGAAGTSLGADPNRFIKGTLFASRPPLLTLTIAHHGGTGHS